MKSSHRDMLWGHSWKIINLRMKLHDFSASSCSQNIMEDVASGTFRKMLNVINELGGTCKGTCAAYKTHIFIDQRDHPWKAINLFEVLWKWALKERWDGPPHGEGHVIQCSVANWLWRWLISLKSIKYLVKMHMLGTWDGQSHGIAHAKKFFLLILNKVHNQLKVIYMLWLHESAIMTT